MAGGLVWGAGWLRGWLWLVRGDGGEGCVRAGQQWGRGAGSGWGGRAARGGGTPSDRPVCRCNTLISSRRTPHTSYENPVIAVKYDAVQGAGVGVVTIGGLTAGTSGLAAAAVRWLLRWLLRCGGCCGSAAVVPLPRSLLLRRGCGLHASSSGGVWELPGMTDGEPCVWQGASAELGQAGGRTPRLLLLQTVAMAACLALTVR